jgi:ABC-2 type transport system permease protein
VALVHGASAPEELHHEPQLLASVADYNPVNWAIEAGREAVQSNVDWATVAGYCGLLAAFALACTMLATRAFGAYQAQV